MEKKRGRPKITPPPIEEGASLVKNDSTKRKTQMKVVRHKYHGRPPTSMSKDPDMFKGSYLYSTGGLIQKMCANKGWDYAKTKHVIDEFLNMAASTLFHLNAIKLSRIGTITPIFRYDNANNRVICQSKFDIIPGAKFEMDCKARMFMGHIQDRDTFQLEMETWLTREPPAYVYATKTRNQPSTVRSLRILSKKRERGKTEAYAKMKTDKQKKQAIKNFFKIPKK